MAQKNDPAADARAAAVEADKAVAKAQQASMDALEQSAIDLQTKSSDARFSTGEWASDPNPLNEFPAPGPIYLEYPGEAREEKS